MFTGHVYICKPVVTTIENRRVVAPKKCKFVKIECDRDRPSLCLFTEAAPTPTIEENNSNK